MYFVKDICAATYLVSLALAVRISTALTSWLYSMFAHLKCHCNGARV